jgi:hypothetical protein
MTGALDGNFRRYQKKICAYLKKNNKDYSTLPYYVRGYTEEEFDIRIKEVYEIKGDVTPDKILMAKTKAENTEPSEHEQQAELCKYMDTKKLKYFAVPNGVMFMSGDTTSRARYANYLKKEGLRTGSPDLVILLGEGRVLFLEMKTTKGKMSEEQKKWKEWFMVHDYNYEVCYGVENAKKVVDKYLTL